MRQHAAETHRQFVKANAQAKMWKEECEALKKLCEEIKAERDRLALAYAKLNHTLKTKV